MMDLKGYFQDKTKILKHNEEYDGYVDCFFDYEYFEDDEDDYPSSIEWFKCWLNMKQPFLKDKYLVYCYKLFYIQKLFWKKNMKLKTILSTCYDINDLYENTNLTIEEHYNKPYFINLL